MLSRTISPILRGIGRERHHGRMGCLTRLRIMRPTLSSFRASRLSKQGKSGSVRHRVLKCHALIIQGPGLDHLRFGGVASADRDRVKSSAHDKRPDWLIPFSCRHSRLVQVQPVSSVWTSWQPAWHFTCLILSCPSWEATIPC